MLPALLRARMLTIHGGVTILLENDQAAGEPSYDAALALYRELNDVRGAGEDPDATGRPRGHTRRRGRGPPAHRSRPDDDRGLDLPVIEAQGLSTLGSLAENEGDLEGALELYRESAEVAASSGFALWETWARTSVAETAINLGRYEVADSAAQAALAKAWEHGDRRISLLSLALLARSALGRGDIERAGRLWGAVDAENADGHVLVMNDGLLRLTAPLRAADDPSFADAAREARDAPFEDAVEVALAGT